MALAAKKGNSAPEAVINRARLAALPDGVIIYSADGQCRSANEAAGKLLGIPRERLLKQNFREISSWKEWGLLARAEETMRTGRPLRWETSITPAPGTSLWLDFRLTRVAIDGEATLLVILADVSERKRADEALRVSEERCRVLADITSDLIFSFDRDLNLTGLNRAAARSLGLKMEEALGRHIADLGLPPEIHRRWKRKCSQVLASGRPAERLLNEFTLADGQAHLNETSLWPILASGGGVVGVQGVTRDITERKQAEELLRASEQRYRTLFSSANDGIILHDLEGRILETNSIVSERLGYSSEDLMGMNVTDIRDSEAATPYPEHMDEVRKWGRAVFETTHLRRDGSTVPVEVSSRLLEDGGREVVLSISRDVTERRQAEDVRRQSEEQFRQMFDHMNSGVAIYEAVGEGTDFVIKEFNPAAELATKRPRADVLGCRVTRIFPDVTGFGLLEVFQRVWKTGISERHPASLYEDERLTFWAENYVYRLPSGEIVAIFDDITERKQMEESLRLTRFSVERAGDGVIWLDPAGRVFYVNDSLCTRLGYARDELLGMTIFDVSVGLQPEAWPVRWLEVKEHSPLTFEKQYRTKNGEIFPVEITSSILEHEGHEYNYGFVRDITERKKTEEALLLTQLAVDRSADLVHWVSPEGEILYVNDLACLRHGYTREEMLGMRLWDLDPKLSPEVWQKRWHKIKRRGFSVFEVTHRAKSGELFPLEVTSNYIKHGDKEYEFAFMRDITERKRAEEALRKSEKRYRTLFASANDMVTIHDFAGRILEVNKVATERLGYSHDELLGMTVTDIRSPEAAGLLGTQMDGLRHQGRAVFETEHQRRDGSHMPVEVSSCLIDYGDAQAVLSIARDLTERKRAEQALRERDDQLRQAQKMEAIGQLAGGIAHDFNNLLTAIIGNSFLALAAMSPDDPNRPLVADIYEAGERAAGLTRQILAFSRRQVLRPCVLCLNDILASMESLLRRTLGEDIDLHFFLAADLKDVEVDRGQMEQVLMNLAVNARDAMPQGGSLTVETANVVLDKKYARTHAEVESGPHIMLAVTDTGCGMDKETASHVFEPFFTTKEVGKGTGLGLSTAFGIVKQSGGSISVYSEPSKGSTFKVYLPAAEAPVAPLAESADGQDESRRGSERILVVEDEAPVRELVVRVLSRSGYRVMAAGSAQEVEEVLDSVEHHPDLLLTDVVLPGGANGRQVAETVLKRFPHLRVLFMSGYTRNAVVHDGRLDEGIVFLQKPFTPETLLRKVREVLDVEATRAYQLVKSESG